MKSLLFIVGVCIAEQYKSLNRKKIVKFYFTRSFRGIKRLPLVSTQHNSKRYAILTNDASPIFFNKTLAALECFFPLLSSEYGRERRRKCGNITADFQTYILVTYTSYKSPKYSNFSYQTYQRSYDFVVYPTQLLQVLFKFGLKSLS